jgi:hypothetical protein
MSSFKEQCVALRRQDKTLPEIMTITGRSKTSIFFHIRHIPLSTQKMVEIRKASGARIRPYGAARKGKSEKSFIALSTWTPDTVLLLGHFMFDGELGRGGCMYNNRSLALIARVKRLMRMVYAHEGKESKDKKTGVYRVSYFNVALSAHFREKASQLLEEILQLPLTTKREFVRAFFDDEGCMDFRPESNQRKIRGYQKNTKILDLIVKLLKEFGIQSRFEPPNEVMIIGKDNLISFQNEINFSPGICINGNRTNSRWKKQLEKRELLRMAIKSFKH